MKYNQEKGIITTLTLVFAGIFLLVIGGLFGFILLQNRFSLERVGLQNSLHIAEAGLDYYKWRLVHFPNDLQDGTGGPGPYVHDYEDATGTVKGTFSLDIQGTSQCGEVVGAVITSTGWTDEFPDAERTVQASYVRPSVADFSFMINDNVWAGSDRVITGPYHSNGGIRMDGDNRSTVTSAVASWTCTSSFGCNPDSTQNGVFTTANGNPALFSFPVPPFDFNGITVDLAAIKNLALPVAQGGQGLGLYFGPSPSGNGYHAVLNNANMDVYDITSLDNITAYNSTLGWHTENSVILAENLIGTFAIPSGCSVVFFEDDLWIEGTVQGKTTIAAADLINPTGTSSVWLQDSIMYTATTGTDGLVVIAEDNNLIGLDTPDDMFLNGIFVAQNGRFGRNYYSCGTYPADCQKNNLQIIGTVVSNGRVGTKWSCGGIFCSGYDNRETIFDPQQGTSPPPFLPTTSPEFGIRNWEEVE